MILEIITPPDHTPVSNGSGVTGSIPGILTVSDTKISAGNTTDMKLISTILIENRNTIHGIMLCFRANPVLFEPNLLLHILGIIKWLGL